MRPRFTSLTSGLLLGLLLSGCATIVSGTRQKMRVVGQPAGSAIYVNDQLVQPKPLPDGSVQIRLPRRGSQEVRVTHEGYKDYHELLTATNLNPWVFLNGVGLPIAFSGIGSTTDKYGTTPSATTIGVGSGIVLVGPVIDLFTGAAYKFEKDYIQPLMLRLPKVVTGSQSVAAGTISVHLKGGEKMGSYFIRHNSKETLYFGQSLDVASENLQTTVNSRLKDLGYTVPTSGQSLFSASSSARYTVQGDMRTVRYDINADNPYEPIAHFATTCTVEVTWKLVTQTRQTVVEQKTSGTSVKFEKGGRAAFEDAFESALYAFLDQPEVAAALAGKGVAVAAGAAATPAGAAVAPTKPLAEQAAISIRRPAPLKLTGDNGVVAAARCVATIITGTGHGSGCFISADGYLVTNAHVVGDEQTVQMTLADGLQATGHVVRVNPDVDLALVKVDTDNLPAFRLPTANTAEIGSDVYAIGTPADRELGQSISKGIISGRRKLDGHTLLQTDVSINGGSSGGALVTHGGQLLGIVNAKLVGRGIEGIGFAIPADQVREALQLTVVD